VQASVWG